MVRDKKNSLKSISLIGAAGLLLLAGMMAGGIFSGGRALAQSPAGTGDANTYVFEGGESILDMLSTLRSVKLDVSFFEDDIFRSLTDYSVELTLPETKGRKNPFAPF